jgi:hypothetical protein
VGEKKICYDLFIYFVVNDLNLVILVLQVFVWNSILVTLIQLQCCGDMPVIQVVGWGEWCGLPAQKGQRGDKPNEYPILKILSALKKIVKLFKQKKTR